MIIVPSLVAYWRFEGNGLDASGKGNNGTISGASSATGKFGDCLSFDGTDDYVDLGDKSSFKFGPTDSFTISLWFKTSVAAPAASAVILTKYRQNGSKIPIHVCITTSTNLPLFALYDGSYNPSVSGTFAVNDGVWHNFTATRKGTAPKTLSLYIDGKFIVSAADTTTGIIDDTTKAIIGGMWNSAQTAVVDTTQFTGLIDEVMIFNRALAENDIRRIMVGLHPLGG